MRKPEEHIDFRNAIFQKFTGYTPGEQPNTRDWIKLNTNENPFKPSEKIQEKLQELSKDSNPLRKYPHASAEPLRSAIADTYSINPEDVVITNGSDEAISLICRIFIGPQESVAIPEITYSLYETIVQSVGSQLLKVPMISPMMSDKDSDEVIEKESNEVNGNNGIKKNKERNKKSQKEEEFQVDLQALESSKAKIIFLPNPNAPTGEFIKTDKLATIIKSSKKLWIIDEAYNDFVAENNASFVHKIKDFTNVIVIRTFSKSHGLAGLRIGYAISTNPFIMEGFRMGKDSYNEDYLAIELGNIAWKDTQWLKNTTQIIIKERERMHKFFSELGFYTLPSEANFLFVKAPAGYQAESIYKSLKNKKILVRYFSQPQLQNHLRISIGSPKENTKLIEAITTILQK